MNNEALAHNLMPEILHALEEAQIELEEARAERDYYRKKAEAGMKLRDRVVKLGGSFVEHRIKDAIAEYDKSVNE